LRRDDCNQVIDAGVGERARFLHFDDQPGLEGLHATFVRHRYALHTHPTFTIALVEQGAVTFELDGHEHFAPAGTVFVIPPGAAHTGRSATPRGYTYKVLYVDPGHAAAALGGTPHKGTAPAGVVLDDPRLAAGLARTHRLLAGAPGGLAADEAVTVSLAALGSLVAAAGPSRPRHRHAAVGRARAHLEDHFAERVQLADLARVAGVSPFHLTRTFHGELGMPPSAYQRQLRIELAKRRLRSDAPAAQVAAECGFSDQPHLVREFKRVVGVTPGAFAAAH
jgi:AraC-like DNA-binding protein